MSAGSAGRSDETMIKGARILVTGASGQVAFPIAAYLARDNDVFGVARFGEAEAAERVRAAGVTPIAADLASADFAAVPADIDYLLHFGFTRGGADHFDQAMRVNGEGTGLILQHCRNARAALVVSSAAIYSPNPDPWFAHREEGELGRTYAPWSPTSPVTKVAEEAVSRFAARAFGLPVTIARLNTVYGSAANLPSMHIRQIQAGETIVVPSDPNNHSPIHVDDICAQIEPLLGAASVPATIVNWAGDEVVSAQRWCAEAAALLGLEARLEVRTGPNVPPSNIADTVRRHAITGPCTVAFADGLRRLVDAQDRG
jgi:nucleoside-diphosphate-sugar epimerase